MSRVFAYCRVSTADQVTANQRQEIEAAGFVLERHRIIEECISGSAPSSQRPGFMRLIDRLEPGDVLVVTKLDRLGRNAMDVRATVERLETNQVRVHCLALGGVDLTSAAGKMTMQVIAAVAEFERDLLIERTQSGIRRARAQGKRLGRPVPVKPRTTHPGITTPGLWHDRRASGKGIRHQPSNHPTGTRRDGRWSPLMGDSKGGR